jgi:hypothetical protein
MDACSLRPVEVDEDLAAGLNAIEQDQELGDG